MKQEEFEKKLNELKAPSAEHIKPPMELKLAIVNAQRSATIGIWFIVVPYIFLAVMLLKYELDVNLGFLNAFAQAVGFIDGNPFLWWIQPLVLFGLPILGIVLNVLSITHFRWEPDTYSLTVTVKLRWFNVVVLFVSALIVTAFLLYLIGENLRGT